MVLLSLVSYVPAYNALVIFTIRKFHTPDYENNGKSNTPLKIRGRESGEVSLSKEPNTHCANELKKELQLSANAHMKITENFFRNFLQCPYKAFRLLKGESGQTSDYEILQNELHSDYVQKVLRNFTDYKHPPRSNFFARAFGLERELLKDVQLANDDISVSMTESSPKSNFN